MRVRELRIFQDILRVIVKPSLLVVAISVGLASCGGGYNSGSYTGGTYKVGKPYVINGKRYIPRVDPNYDRTGLASWYGDKFHGRTTANGERFDMYAMTAAHTTLPMPTNVRVTNLENGRSLILRVNDRGPFVPGRIIDVSKRAARELGFYSQGTAKVRVQFVGRAMLNESFIANKAKTSRKERKAASAAPTAAITKAAVLAPPPGAEAAPAVVPAPKTVAASAPVADRQATGSIATAPSSRVSYVPVTGKNEIFVQVGAFMSSVDAQETKLKLSGLGQVDMTTKNVDGKDYYLLMIGPMKSVQAADAKLDALLNRGFADARITIE